MSEAVAVPNTDARKKKKQMTRGQRRLFYAKRKNRNDYKRVLGGLVVSLPARMLCASFGEGYIAHAKCGAYHLLVSKNDHGEFFCSRVNRIRTEAGQPGISLVTRVEPVPSSTRGGAVNFLRWKIAEENHGCNKIVTVIAD